MDSNRSAPAIVITVINDCAGLWHEVLLGEEEASFPASASPGWRCRSRQRGRRAQLAAAVVGIACDRHSLVVHYRIYPHRHRFYADASSGQSGPSQYR
ncbi:hypothetical protein KCP77_11490 [Salmonella enterica subsp. enterica]|nr:hypothetical protein KCP77_11490 [Salmonella enterica subsp. enterica]